MKTAAARGRLPGCSGRWRRRLGLNPGDLRIVVNPSSRRATSEPRSRGTGTERADPAPSGKVRSADAGRPLPVGSRTGPYGAAPRGWRVRRVGAGGARSRGDRRSGRTRRRVPASRGQLAGEPAGSRGHGRQGFARRHRQGHAKARDRADSQGPQAHLLDLDGRRHQSALDSAGDGFLHGARGSAQPGEGTRRAGGQHQFQALQALPARNIRLLCSADAAGGRAVRPEIADRHGPLRADRGGTLCGGVRIAAPGAREYSEAAEVEERARGEGDSLEQAGAGRPGEAAGDQGARGGDQKAGRRGSRQKYPGRRPGPQGGFRGDQGADGRFLHLRRQSAGGPRPRREVSSRAGQDAGAGTRAGGLRRARYPDRPVADEASVRGQRDQAGRRKSQCGGTPPKDVPDAGELPAGVQERGKGRGADIPGPVRLGGYGRRGVPGVPVDQGGSPKKPAIFHEGR